MADRPSYGRLVDRVREALRPAPPDRATDADAEDPVPAEETVRELQREAEDPDRRQ